MTQSSIIAFEESVDAFMQGIKIELLKRQQICVTHQAMPQCLDCLRVTDEESNDLMLRLILIGYNPQLTVGRLSWLEGTGREHICCYLNSSFEAIKLKRNHIWAKEKHTAEAMCLMEWSRIHSPLIR
ncbi:hypothetical protein DN730_09375 [Marinomonas piezotolerans]|uniref:Uncharacterized protein n=1 Tax=Marinomonas piezotolerans TaxID=2213058 RepID=A0A370U9Y0_9GAMM|nr:hypothetical protein [Marinomonas piezotolerans]RDL44589.1 hypothetical protein DN730_09375 [Marinomonas piezotolerans]